MTRILLLTQGTTQTKAFITKRIQTNFKKSKILSDFGFLIGEAGTKGDLFYNIVGGFDNNKSYELNLEGVKGDNYLKNHSLKDNSLLIDNENKLLSNLDIDWDFEDSQLSTSFKIYEDLSRGDHNRYQYVSKFVFIKNIDIQENTMVNLHLIHTVIIRYIIQMLKKACS